MSEDHPAETVRALIITQKFPPESIGGAHRWHRLAQNFPEQIEPQVLAPPPTIPVGMFDRSSQLWENEMIEDIPVTRLWTYQPTGGEWTGLGRILNYVVFALFASFYVLTYWWRYDCIVSFIGPHSTLLPGLLGRAFGRSWVIDIEDMWIDNAADLGFVARGSLVHRAVERVERFAFALADGFTVITQTMAEQYADKHDLPPETFTVVPTGIDVDTFLVEDDTTAAEGPIVYTGKLGQGQAFEPFLRGFARLDSSRELHIFGFGDRRDELEELSRQLDIEERVSVKEPVEREKIPGILQSAALAWVPLKTEYSLDYARPTKLIETMAAGTPYVASQVAEIEAVTADSGAGKAVENSPESVANAMRELLADEEHRVESGRRGTAFVAENHQWDVLGARTGDVILTAVSQ